MSLDIEERVTLDVFNPWDRNRCPAVVRGGVRCKNPRLYANYKLREFCSYHGKHRPRCKFIPNAVQLAAEAKTDEVKA